MKFRLFVLFTLLIISGVIGQTVLPKNAPFDQLIDFGKPLQKANAEIIGKIFPSTKCSGDYTAIIVDYGQLDPLDGVIPLGVLKFYFVDLISKNIEYVPVKDLLGNDVTTPIGSLGASGRVYGLDNCYYISTLVGGHVLKLDYKNRTITDLGNPYSFLNNGAPNITTLMLGTDGAINGIYNTYYGQPAKAFRYEYDCGFKELDSDVIDPNGSRTKQIGSDKTFQYAISQEGDNYKLIGINRQSRAKSQIPLIYQGTILTSTIPIEMETYIGDYVYARVSDFNKTGTVVYWKLKDGQVIEVTNVGPQGSYNDKRRIRADGVWYDHDFKQYEHFSTPVLNVIDLKLLYQLNGQPDFVDLSAVLSKHFQPTMAITPYLNAQSSVMELFVNGAKYSMAASLDIPNAQSQDLGKSTTEAYSAISDFNTTNVWLAGYPNGLISKYTSSSNWNLFNSYNSPVPESPTANPLIKYYIHKKENSINNVWGPISINNIKKISPNFLVAAGGNSRETNNPYEAEELALSIINVDGISTAAIMNIYDPKFDPYRYSAMDVENNDKLIFLLGSRKTSIPGQAHNRLFILNTSGTISQEFDLLDPLGRTTLVSRPESDIKVFGKSIYFVGSYTHPTKNIQNCVFKIADYTVSTIPEVLCITNGLGYFYNCVGLSPDGTYLWTMVLKQNSEGIGIPIYMPTNISNDVYDYHTGTFINNQVKIINGEIPIDPLGMFRPQMSYMNVDCQGYVLISGRTSIYGFKPTGYQGTGFSERIAPKKQPLLNTIKANK